MQVYYNICSFFSLQIFLFVSLFLLCVSLSFQWAIQQFSIDNIMAFYSGRKTTYFLCSRFFFHHILCVLSERWVCCWGYYKVGTGWRQTIAHPNPTNRTIYSRWLMIFVITNHRHSAIFGQQVLYCYYFLSLSLNHDSHQLWSRGVWVDDAHLVQHFLNHLRKNKSMNLHSYSMFTFGSTWIQWNLLNWLYFISWLNELFLQIQYLIKNTSINATTIQFLEQNYYSTFTYDFGSFKWHSTMYTTSKQKHMETNILLKYSVVANTLLLMYVQVLLSHIK